MKVIDLLNKIANGEKIPKKIKVYGGIYTLDDSLNYMDENNKNDWLAFIDGDELTTYEVEMIEEDKKIEKIKILNCDDYVKKENYETILTMQEITLDIQTLKNKINEIIDYLEEKE